jgi:rhodanese-related sulfurtransferase
MFWGAEFAEAYFGEKRPASQIRLMPRKGRNLIAAIVLVIGCIALVAKGQPTAEQRWAKIADTGNKLIRKRAVFVHPAEIVELKSDMALSVRIFDLRDERDFNLFHIGESQRVPPSEITDPSFVKGLLDLPDNAIVFLVSNGEKTALSVWKNLKAQGVVNLYIVEGGINRWLDLYPLPRCLASKVNAKGKRANSERLAYRFNYAVGSRSHAAFPHLEIGKWPEVCLASESAAHAAGPQTAHHEETKKTRSYTKKVKLQKKRVIKGGCG